VDTSSTHVEINHGRRRFLGTAALAVGAVGAAQAGMIASAKAQTGQAKASVLSAAQSGTAAAFGLARAWKMALNRNPYIVTG
jgi:hypothetical protein